MKRRVRTARSIRHRGRSSRWKKGMVGSVVALTLLTIALALLAFLPKEAPFRELELAWLTVRTARDRGAPLYASKDFARAEKQLERARAEIRAQNRRFFLSRSYDQAGKLAERTKFQALVAVNRAISAKDSVLAEAVARINMAQQALADFKNTSKGIPVEPELRRTATQSELRLLESLAAFKRGDYFAAAKNAHLATAGATDAHTKVATNLRQYFNNKSKWNQWAKETIDWSARNKAYAIIIDKMAHLCQVYYNGELKATYLVELGPQWIGPKRYKGDGATPEGRYQVIRKKGPKQTKYYKALEINYPNEEDWAHFRQAQSNRTLSRFATLGGLIEIHGDGGQGLDWTQGCIALTNTDMDQLFEMASEGTPVTIVGSLYHLTDPQKTDSHAR